METNPTRRPPCMAGLTGMKSETTAGVRSIVWHDNDHNALRMGPIERIRRGATNVAAIPITTATARSPAMSGVEKLEY